MRKTHKKNRRSKEQHGAGLEMLESRQLYSVVTVTPQNFLAAINSSNVGDTISFTPDTYTLTTNSSGPAATFPAGRHYIGNGSTLQLSTGVSTSNNKELIRVNGNSNVTEFTGFTFTDAQLHCEGGVFNVHNNTFTNGYRGIFVTAQYNSHFDDNTFSHLAQEGIFGYPGNNNTYDNNRFDYVWEPIHLLANNSGTDISNNVITHPQRIGIELQLGMTNMTVENNWISDWIPFITNGVDNHMAISCATGGAESAPFAGQGQNITISGNTLLQTGPDQSLNQWAKSAIEIMGSTGITVSNNYTWGWGQGILNGVTGQGLTSSNNVFIGTTSYAPDAVPWPITSRHGSGDQFYGLNASNAPGFPAMNTSNVGANANGSSSSAPSTPSAPTLPVVTATPVAAPTNFAGTSPANSEIDLSWTDNTSGKGTYILQRRATNGSDGFTAIATLAAGSTSYADKTVNASWQYTYQLVAAVSGTSSSAATVQVQAAPVVTIPVVIPPVVDTPAPVTPPVVVPPVVVPPVVTPVTAAATGFAATSPSSSEIDLSWTDNTAGTGTYVLQRRATNGRAGFVTIATLPTGTTSYTDTSVNANWEYNYRLTAVVNNVSSSVIGVHVQVQAAPVTVPVVPVNPPVVSTPVTPPVVVPPVVVPPVVAPVTTSVTAAPSNFVAYSPNSTEVLLSWTDNTSGTGTYILQRRATKGRGGFVTIATLPAGTAAYTDTSVTPNWEYNYQLVAVVNGVSSSIVGVHTQVQQVPSAVTPVTESVSRPSDSPVTARGTAAPTNFTATSPSNSEVDLSWTDNSSGTAAYVVQRRATRGKAAFQTLATLAAGTTSYADKHVTRNWEYQYRMVAVVSGIASPSVETNAHVLNTGRQAGAPKVGNPAAPTVLLAASPDARGIELSWVDHNGGATKYIVGRRATYGSSDYQVVATLRAGTTTFRDANVEANWEYDYYVQAVTDTGAASAAATVHVRAEPMIQFLLSRAA
jgi:fibronectin type 3 domain-containing protein